MLSEARYCLPVCSPSAGGLVNIGTSFFMRFDGKIFLTTCGHLGHKSNPPSSDWSLWNSEIWAFIKRGAHIVVPLFNEVDGKRVPRFHYLLNQGDSTIADMLMIEASTIPLVDTLLAATRVWESKPWSAKYGDQINVQGFPNLDSSGWPYEPANSVSGPLLKSEGAALHCGMNIENGHSGGPAYKAATDELVGMAFGAVGDVNELGAIISTAALNAVARFGATGGKVDGLTED